MRNRSVGVNDGGGTGGCCGGGGVAGGGGGGGGGDAGGGGGGGVVVMGAHPTHGATMMRTSTNVLIVEIRIEGASHGRRVHADAGRPLHVRAVDRRQSRTGPVRARDPSAARSRRHRAQAG